jgi:hypothetical protein
MPKIGNAALGRPLIRRRVIIEASELNAAATTQSVSLGTLPTGAVVEQVWHEVPVLLADAGSISAVALEVGTSGDPDYLIASTAVLEVYQNGARQTLSAASATVYRPDGTTFATPTVVLSDGDKLGTVNITGASTASESLGDGWRISYVVTVGGDVYEFANEAMLVRSALYPVLTDADLYKRVSSLDPDGTTPITSLESFQDFRDEAWIEISQRLIQEGNRPALVLSPTALRGAHLELTLAIVFEDLSTRLNEAYEARAQQYRRQYEQTWRRLTFRYDADENGNPDDVRRRRGHGTLWMCGGRARSVR